MQMICQPHSWGYHCAVHVWTLSYMLAAIHQTCVHLAVEVRVVGAIDPRNGQQMKGRPDPEAGPIPV